MFKRTKFRKRSCWSYFPVPHIDLTALYWSFLERSVTDVYTGRHKEEWAKLRIYRVRVRFEHLQIKTRFFLTIREQLENNRRYDD